MISATLVALCAALITLPVWVDLPRRWTGRRGRAWVDRAALIRLADKYGAESSDRISERMASVGQVLPTNGGGLAMWNGFDWVPVPVVNHDDKVTKE